MRVSITRLSALALAAMIGVTATQAASPDQAPDLPILVDQYYEIKNPSGPVSAGDLVLRQKLTAEQIRKLTEPPRYVPMEELAPLGF